MTEHLVMHHDDIRAVNTEEHPENVVPVSVPVSRVDGGRAEIPLKSLSWNVLRFSPV